MHRKATPVAINLKDRILRGDSPLLLPGAPNALSARVVEEIGFEAVYLSGAGIANTYLGVPDIGLLTMTELVAHVGATRDVVDIPIIADGDTGFGNAINVSRTVKELARVGANGMQLEDQTSPKRCGHFEGKSIIELGEMVGKIHAAVDARPDDDFIIIARTDARAVTDFDDACARANRFLEEGADVAFVEAPVSVAELRELPQRVAGPLLVNLVEGAKTPQLPLDELDGMGYRVVLYANAAMRGAVFGMRRVLDILKENGSTEDALDHMIGWEERQRLVKKSLYDEFDQRYAAAAER